MFLRRTSACSEFRERLGQANHLLITILVGIEGVRKGSVTKSDEFHAAWNPKSLEDSAQRSRRFARDAMLNHVVDSLGVYLSLLRKRPFSAVLPGLTGAEERSLKVRLDAFSTDLGLHVSLSLSLVHLAIQWRNRRLHTGAENAVEQQHVGTMRARRDELRERFSGLEVDELLSRFGASESPRFKEVASLVKGSLDFVQMADALVVRRVDPSDVARIVVASTLRERVAKDRRRAGQQWGNTVDERYRRLAGLLTTAGFVAGEDVGGTPELPDEFIDNLANMPYRAVCDQFEIDLAAG